MPHARLPDWQRRLADHVRAAAGRPFSWGRSDCCLWVCDGIAAMTGVDPAAAFRGRYRTELGAMRALRRLGAGSLEATAVMLGQAFGWPEIAPADARSGDVGLIETRDGPALALCYGWTWIAKAPDGLVSAADLRAARRAWAVGRA